MNKGLNQITEKVSLYQEKNALQKAGERLNELFAAHKNDQILFLSSGGSAFALLDYISSSSLGPHIKITVLDERFNDDPKVNNFNQLSETDFYKRAVKNGCSFINTSASESQDELALFFEKELKKWKQINPEGVVLCTQGMGEDGHTAGIMPFPKDPLLFKKLFQNDEWWVVSYDAFEKNPYPLRVTTTLPFLANIVDYSVFYIAGENKYEKLEALLGQKGEVSQFPSLIIYQMKNVAVFTDLNLL